MQLASPGLCQMQTKTGKNRNVFKFFYLQLSSPNLKWECDIQIGFLYKHNQVKYLSIKMHSDVCILKTLENSLLYLKKYFIKWQEVK